MAGSRVPDQPRWRIAPYFIVDDVVDTANYYRDDLGFRYERFWSDPPAFCMVSRNGVIIMLAQVERSKGVNIARDICDQVYGCRDFDVEDRNGYRLCFGQPTDGG